MRKCKILAVLLAVCCFCGLCVACSQSEHDKIADAWGKLHNTEGEIEVSCFGEFDNAHVVMISDWSYVPCVTGGETVDGVDFYYNYASICLNVWHDGKFYGLQDAFDYGFLTHENLLTVRENHKNKFSFMYENDAN